MGLYIRGGGVLILGQDQDTVGGTFDPNQAFIGELSQFNIWDRILSINQIISNMADCSGTGNVYSWHTNNIISSETFTIELLKEICGQPNNFQGLQDCVEMMDIYGNWNDANCLNKQRFVCKTYIVPRDCSDARSHGFTQSGIYTIDPDGKGSFDVYCDMDTDDGGYTIIQRRFDMSIDFNRDWNEYKLGFGDLNSEFWLGNEKLNRLTGQRRQELRVDLVNVQGEAAFIVYDYFSIAHENDKYRLRVGHKTNGDLGDKLDYHRNMQFTTRDSDNDMSSASNCAVSYYSGWWYNTCHHAELNVEYGQYNSLQWDDWETPSISGSMMKIRKADHEPPVVYW
ncbi:fibrinogen-like protein A [Glandiceps talaboti]